MPATQKRESLEAGDLLGAISQSPRQSWALNSGGGSGGGAGRGGCVQASMSEQHLLGPERKDTLELRAVVARAEPPIQVQGRGPLWEKGSESQTARAEQ